MPPDKIDRYEVKSTLGTGAMGSVHMAWDPKLHRDVAIKVLRADVTRDGKIRSRFQREARAVAALRHPNIVEIYDYSGETSSFLYIVMEKLEGDDLFNIVADNGSMPEPIVAAVGHELCLALGVAHEAGIIHRDLKPENVFISPNGRVVLTDFGIAKAVDEEGQKIDGAGLQTDVIGTPGFMPPELMMNKALGHYTDVFALGALLYNIATGRLPYDGTGPVEIFRNIMSGQFDDPRKHNSYLSEEFCNVIAATLQPKPKKRTQSVDGVREGLKGVLANCGVTDLRDDMREYMTDPRKYWDLSRARTANTLLQQIKIAIKDRDNDAAESLRLRLQIIDPSNSDIHQVSGLMELPDVSRFLAEDKTAQYEKGDAGLLTAPEYDEPRATADPPSTGGRKLLYAGVVLVIAALGAAAALMFGGGGTIPDDPTVPPAVTGAGQPDPGAPKNVAGSTVDTAGAEDPRPRSGEVQMGWVEVQVKGGAGTLFVDGEKLGRIKKSRRLELAEGAHVIEVGARRRKLKKSVVVVAGAEVHVLAEVRKGKISLKE